MSLTVYTSNRMERLADQLGEVLSVSLAAPLTREVIVVQSKGMQRWLAMELARRFGVWANCSYPFPNKFVGDIFRDAMADMPAPEEFGPGAMLWRIMGLVDRFLEHEAFVELKGYLSGASLGLKKYQLAGKIADTFDQYTIFRGDLLAGWEAGGDDSWQALLWRALVAEVGSQHRSSVQAEFLRRLAAGRIERSLFPERITVFGISYLPNFHLQVLASLAAFTQVNLFIMSPCQQYWGDILPERVRLKLPPLSRENVDQGNPLLASLGRLGRDFSNVILACEDLSGGEQSLYREAAEPTLLADLQNSILNLSTTGDGAKTAIAPGDRTVALHSCHSAMREVEVLHDNLLDLFARDRELKPRDILVMTPDIESYAPFISAVFDAPPGTDNRIPYSIADRTIRYEGRLAKAFLAILELPGKRFSAPAVMDILSCSAIQRKFGLQDADLDQVKTWIEETVIRWGLDEHEREQAGLPPYRDHSWMAGLDRLLLGYALPEQDDRLFDGLLPYDNMEGSAPLLLGRLVTFVRNLHRLVAGLERQATLAAWQETLLGIFAGFFDSDDDDAREADTIATVIADLARTQQLSAFRDEIGLDVIRSWLQGRLDSEGRGFGFLAGGVTFCAMLPMRSIPFRVIALIGMNDGAFPRQNRVPGFDLISRSPRPGDRSLRDEDRYLFLESLLSSRERLYISYIGQSISDNSPVPPSVLVSELLDYLERHYQVPGGDLLASLVTRHRLQPFSPDYFNGTSRLFSYSRENCEAVAKRLSGADSRRSFISRELPQPPETMRTIPLGSLLGFYAHPARYLLRNRLGISLDEPAAPLEEREPFEIDGLEAYALKQKIIELTLAGGNQQDLLPLARAKGILPPAGPGQLAFEESAAVAVELAGSVKACLAGEDELAPLDFDLAIGEFRLYGRLAGLRPGRLLRYRCAKLAAKDQIGLWIEHLLLNLLDKEGYPKKSTLVMSDSTVELMPFSDSEQCLRLLLESYWQGLKLPLKFFPRSSLKYAESGNLGQAQTVWSGERYPENDDPCYRLCFGDQDPLDGDFMELAVALFGRYLHCRGH